MFEDEEEELDARSLPIFKKGQEIVDVVNEIVDLIPDDDNQQLNSVAQFMLADSFQLTVKIVGAEAGGLYDIKMEAASIIRKAAHDLLLSNHSLKMYGFKDVHYFQIVRDLLEEYRLLFIDWVAGFDQWDYVTDRWGLFNPPGVGPFDKDPDDDIPFDNPFK